MRPCVPKAIIFVTHNPFILALAPLGMPCVLQERADIGLRIAQHQGPKGFPRNCFEPMYILYSYMNPLGRSSYFGTLGVSMLPMSGYLEPYGRCSLSLQFTCHYGSRREHRVQPHVVQKRYCASKSPAWISTAMPTTCKRFCSCQ